jgi:hypothetical protein
MMTWKEYGRKWSCSNFLVLTWHSWRNWRRQLKTSFMTASLQAEIRAWDLPNTDQERLMNIIMSRFTAKSDRGDGVTSQTSHTARFVYRATKLSWNRLVPTSSKMSSFSSRCRSSCRDRRCDLPGPGYRGVPPAPTGPLVLVQVAGQSPVRDTDRNVGVPSIVFTMGFKRPPRSNSWAEILRTGVVAPDPALDDGAVPAGSEDPQPGAGLAWWLGDERSAAGGTMQLLVLADVGVAWETNHVSTTCRVAFLPARSGNLTTDKW